MSFSLGLGLTTAALMGGNSLAAIIAALFGAGERGAIWLPEPKYLYQDRFGTTPVTAPGQSVGMRLDVSRGLVPGPELGFANNTLKLSDFTIINNQVIVTELPDRFRITRTATAGEVNQCRISSSAVENNKFYAAEFTILANGPNNNAYSSVSNGGSTYFMAPQYSIGLTKRNAVNIANGLGTGTLLTYFSASRASTPASSVEGDWIEVSKYFSVRELPGAHLVAINDAARGVYQTDGTLHWIQYDGADDGYVSPVITPGTDKAQVFAGIRKLSDAAAGVVLESSASLSSNSGTILLAAPGAGGAGRIDWSSKGTVNADAQISGLATPVSSVATGLGDISGDVSSLRINGSLAQTVTTDQGTGNYTAYPIYVGRRGGTTLPFNGRDYGLITRFGPNLPAPVIAQVERYLAQRAGVSI